MSIDWDAWAERLGTVGDVATALSGEDEDAGDNYYVTEEASLPTWVPWAAAAAAVVVVVALVKR